MSDVVLDSWAVMRVLEAAEPAASTVHELLQREKPWMNWINLGEVFYVVERDTDEETAHATVRDLLVSVEAWLPTRAVVLKAAHLKATYPMSYADAFAAATAMTAKAELWTGDPELLIEGSPWAWRDLRAEGVSWNPRA